MLTLVTAPIRSLAILAIVAEWNEPSSVTGHLTVATSLWNSSLDQATLNLWLLTERRPALAVPTALASRNVAINAVAPSFHEKRINIDLS